MLQINIIKVISRDKINITLINKNQMITVLEVFRVLFNNNETSNTLLQGDGDFYIFKMKLCDWHCENFYCFLSSFQIVNKTLH